jgi:Ni/Co efflux regulator RcnB
MKQKFVAALAAVAVLGAAVTGSVSAAEEHKNPANGHKYPSIEKTSADAPQQHKMSPEFQAQVKKLPPEFIQQFKKMTAKHTRYSEDATARQVMMELLSDVQCVTAGLMVENGEMAADCAVRASRHRWPKGHLLAYVKLEQINADSLAALPKINATVEGGLERVAELALNKNFPGAGAEMGKVLEGCSNCHNLFRFGKGDSPHIID